MLSQKMFSKDTDETLLYEYLFAIIMLMPGLNTLQYIPWCVHKDDGLVVQLPRHVEPGKGLELHDVVP
jgi:hypothetical protein